MFMLLHDGQTSFYVQASTDFVAVAHPKYDANTGTDTVILERILEYRASKEAREQHHKETTQGTHSAVHAVPAVSASPPTASNTFDVEEKQDIRFGRTQWGLEVLRHASPHLSLPGPPEMSMWWREHPAGALVGPPSGIGWKPPLEEGPHWFSADPLLPRAAAPDSGGPLDAHNRGSRK